MSSSLPARHRADSSRTRVGLPGRIRIGVVATTAAAGIAFAAGPAQAAVNFDPSCPYTPSNGTGACGFVGKGDVQTALGFNNDKMQKNAKGLAFTYTQAATQAVSQSATQAGSQAGSQAGTQVATQAGTETASQAISETLSCEGVDGGHHEFSRNGTRDGSRDGTRTGSRTGTRAGTRIGSRTGSRTGSRSGTLSGSVSYAIDYDTRVKNQIDGFFLTGAHTSGFVGSGDPLWNAYNFGEYTFGSYTFGDYTFGDYTFGDYTFGAYTFGDTTWGDWEAAPGEDPSMCDGNNPWIASRSDVVTPGDVSGASVTDGVVTDGAVTDGAVTDGAITDGAITPGAISYGDVTPSGAAHLYVNGVALN